jgi:uncharacterized protein (DUF362 family)
MSKVAEWRRNLDLGISRRGFVAGTAAAGALAATGFRFGSPPMIQERPDIAVAHGPDVEKNARAVIETLGGMAAFVKAGDVVNLLPNAQGSHPGASTNPVLTKTVLEMCKEAGATEVRWLTWLPQQNWERSNLAPLLEASGAKLIAVDINAEDQWDTFDVPRGVKLKQVRIFKVLNECDVFISMPIFKDHLGCRFTGVLKNYMGTSHAMDNRTFHPTFEGENLLHMEHCIADLNTVVRKPDLCVCDAMTILTSKGPFGPGEIAKPNKVVAGVDRVAVDSYGATILGLSGPEINMINNAFAHGLGEIDLSKLSIKELEVA